MFIRETAAQARENRVDIDTKFFGPRGYALSFAVVCKQNIVAFVTCLLALRPPTHVTRFVITIVIDAVKRISRFITMVKRYNMITKRHKVVPPFIANDYAASTIVDVVRLLGIGASLNHARPNFVEPSMALSVSRTPRKKGIHLLATTGFDRAVAKGTINNIVGIAAIALTQPHNLISLVFFDRAKCYKAIKSLSGYVFGQPTEGDILRAHKKFTFLVSSLERFAVAARHFALSFYSFILPYLNEYGNAKRTEAQMQPMLLAAGD